MLSFKSAVLGFGLVLVMGAAAHAQTSPSIANLPPQGPGPGGQATNAMGGQTQAVAPSPVYVGPGPGGQATNAMGGQTQAVAPSPGYVGPGPGGQATNSMGTMGPRAN